MLLFPPLGQGIKTLRPPPSFDKKIFWKWVFASLVRTSCLLLSLFTCSIEYLWIYKKYEEKTWIILPVQSNEFSYAWSLLEDSWGIQTWQAEHSYFPFISEGYRLYYEWNEKNLLLYVVGWLRQIMQVLLSRTSEPPHFFNLVPSLSSCLSTSSVQAFLNKVKLIQ